MEEKKNEKQDISLSSSDLHEKQDDTLEQGMSSNRDISDINGTDHTVYNIGNSTAENNSDADNSDAKRFIGVTSGLEDPQTLIKFFCKLLVSKLTFKNILKSLTSILVLLVVYYILFQYIVIIFLAMFFFKSVRNFCMQHFLNHLSYSLVAILVLVCISFPKLLYILILYVMLMYSLLVLDWIKDCFASYNFLDGLVCLAGLASSLALLLNRYWIENICSGFAWVALLQLAIFVALTFNAAFLTTFFIATENFFAITDKRELGHKNMPKYRYRLNVASSDEKRADLNKQLEELQKKLEKNPEDEGIKGEITRLEERKQWHLNNLISFMDKYDAIDGNYHRDIAYIKSQIFTFSGTRQMLKSISMGWLFGFLAVSVVSGFSVLFILCYFKSELSLSDYALSLLPITKNISPIID
ncbi:hypothetical protein NEMIN01_0391 [Nematocida minor]|uniref:uncharacterized protein n=1 Tax=Nematocida minor TaxID=1912983 RepID=UPI002220C0D4|nr:uncharacterized protein NEMIN01_0391 [Nematocida minor]KAI5189225.1 hypothetical protein NEMIN01_0391 [Nematocida minor]